MGSIRKPTVPSNKEFSRQGRHPFAIPFSRRRLEQEGCLRRVPPRMERKPSPPWPHTGGAA